MSNINVKKPKFKYYNDHYFLLSPDMKSKIYFLHSGSLLTANRNGVDLLKLAVLRVITNVIYSIFKAEETSSAIM